MKNRRNYISNTIFNWTVNKFTLNFQIQLNYIFYLHKLKSIMLRKSNYHKLINKNFLLKYKSY